MRQILHISLILLSTIFLSVFGETRVWKAAPNPHYYYTENGEMRNPKRIFRPHFPSTPVESSRIFYRAQRNTKQVILNENNIAPLSRSSGRFYRKINAVPTHEVSSVQLKNDTVLNGPSVYNHERHHKDKLSIDNQLMDDAIDLGKSMARTTVRSKTFDDLDFTTPTPTVKSTTKKPEIQSSPSPVTPISQQQVEPARIPSQLGMEQSFHAGQRQNIQSIGSQPIQLPQQPPPAFARNEAPSSSQSLFGNPQFPPNPQFPQQNLGVPQQFGPPTLSGNPSQGIQGVNMVGAFPGLPNQQGLPGLGGQQQMPQLNGFPQQTLPLGPQPGLPGLQATSQLQGLQGQLQGLGGSQQVPGLQGGQQSSLPPQGNLPQLQQQPQVPQLPNGLPQLGNLQQQITQIPPNTLSGSSGNNGNPLGSQQGTLPQLESSEMIHSQSANSSLEAYGCGWDIISNSCKDVFGLNWCGHCHDFGNIFLHDCKCVHPNLSNIPRPPPRSQFVSQMQNKGMY